MDTGGARTSSRTGGAVAALDVEAVLAADAAVDSSLDFVAGFFLPEEGPVGGCLTGRPRFLGEALVVSSLVDAAAFLGGRPRFRAVGDDGVVTDLGDTRPRPLEGVFDTSEASFLVGDDGAEPPPLVALLLDDEARLDDAFVAVVAALVGGAQAGQNHSRAFGTSASGGVRQKVWYSSSH